MKLSLIVAIGLCLAATSSLLVSPVAATGSDDVADETPERELWADVYPSRAQGYHYPERGTCPWYNKPHRPPHGGGHWGHRRVRRKERRTGAIDYTYTNTGCKSAGLGERGVCNIRLESLVEQLQIATGSSIGTLEEFNPITDCNFPEVNGIASGTRSWIPAKVLHDLCYCIYTTRAGEPNCDNHCNCHRGIAYPYAGLSDDEGYCDCYCSYESYDDEPFADCGCALGNACIEKYTPPPPPPPDDDDILRKLSSSSVTDEYSSEHQVERREQEYNPKLQALFEAFTGSGGDFGVEQDPEFNYLLCLAGTYDPSLEISAPVSTVEAGAKPAVCQTHATVTGMAWLILQPVVQMNTAVASVDAVLSSSGSMVRQNYSSLNECMRVRR
eukprot:CAMPEP_0178635342 /NCGR_PEP_ID=MMETSP0698-20121128/13114_1 /TAXON_ID=265572 /ORGANISM="Extubocellulus spinifer, Strain CCMP396" /LENGTH=384 /DNA_ID=CAMNT_0020275073 /DNA_START=26 /DNA_END=1181 /DNA_ORIENTATION=-